MSAAYPLVMGASGLTGTETVRRLVEAKTEVRVTYREQAELNTLRELACEIFHADYSEPESVAKAMKDVNRVVLILPIAPNMAEWGKNSINAAKQAGVERLILLSNVAASRESAAEIPRMHGDVIHHLQNSGLTHTVVRPAPYFQNLFWSTITIVRWKKLSLPLGGKLPHIDVRDVGLFLSHVVREDSKENRDYTITGPESLTMFRMARTLGKEVGSNIRFVPTPARAGKQCFRDMGLTPWLCDAINGMYGEYDSGKYDKPTRDFANLTGKKPISFERFAADYYNVFTSDKSAAETPIGRGAV